MLLERFLNEYEAKSLLVDGIYSKSDMRAVISWQEKYGKDVLTPWGLQIGTGFVSTTSLKKIVESGCVTNLPPLSR